MSEQQRGFIVATNLTDLHREPSFLSEMLTQVLNGMTGRILEEEDQWCRVRMSDGYEGWAYRSYLATDVTPPPSTHVVSAPSTQILGPVRDPATRLLAGTHLRVQQEGDRYATVSLAGTLLPGISVPVAALRSLESLPLAAKAARGQIVSDAREFTGVYYLWGGNTTFGIDCSGLAWLTHRLSGYSIPRDSDPQFRAGRPVEPPFAPGDLLFFRSDRDPNRIGHVGISIGGWRMIHSSRSRNGVYEEDVQASDSYKAKFEGARTFLRES